MGWIVQRRQATYGAAQATRLSAVLQVRAELNGYGEPRPRSMQCDGLTLTDPATGRALIHLQKVQLNDRAGACTISAESATIDIEGGGALADKLCLWLRLPAARAIDLRIGRLALSQPAGELVLGAMQARAEQTASMARLRVEVRAPGMSAGEKPAVQLMVERSLPNADAISVIMESSATLPAAALACVPGFAGLDAEARFAGMLRWTQGQGGVTGVAKGLLEGVEIGSLLPAGSPHVANGRAAVTLTEYRWRDATLEQLGGKLTVDKAKVSSSLLAAAVKHLYCVQLSDGVAKSGSKELIDVDRLACRFVLDRKGLTVTGDMPPADDLPAGCLATSGGVGLLMQPQYVDVPAGAWVQFVAGPAKSWLPASAGAIKVAERLPLP
jgi:hypothetical protein